MDRLADGEGESFGFRVNGEDVYVKGANWIPTEAIYARQTADRYDDLLESAVAANMNAVRVWGGGQYERRHFYRRCDELGLLVWQDFMYACATYPSDEAFHLVPGERRVVPFESEADPEAVADGTAVCHLRETY